MNMKKAHREKLSGDESFKCSHCDKSFSFKPCLHKHLRIRHGGKFFTSSECKESFSSSVFLQKHMRGHLGENPDTVAYARRTFRKQHLEVHSVICVRTLFHG
jgi:hypothetical protein